MYRILIIFVFFIMQFVAFAQKEKVKNDTLFSTNDINQFIESHNNQLNVKFEISNEIINYSIPFEGKEADIRTNLNVRYAFVFNYKFASVRFGFRPGISAKEKENKGESNTFRFRIKLLFEKWSHQFEYNYNKGYYVDNFQNISLNNDNPGFHVQFPNLKTNVFTGSSFYKFNDNYSIRAVESNTEIQLKSAGTFLPGITYTYYRFTGTNKIKDSEGNVIERDNYNDYNGFNTILSAGYYYTFVYHKYWYANIFAGPGVGIDFYKTTSFSPNGSFERSFNDPFLIFSTGFSGGYNGKKYFFGLEYDTNFTSEKFNENNVQLLPRRNNFFVFIGYRFKAPKTIKKSIDQIEDKIPILKDENNGN